VPTARRSKSIRAALALTLFTFVGAVAPAGDSTPESGVPSAWRLSYRIPRDWVADRDTAAELNLSTLLVPDGETYRTAPAVITVAYQEKRPELPLPATLQEFFMAEMEPLLRMYPDLESQSWRPRSLDSTDLEYAGLEVFGDVPRYIRIVLVDAGDGFYAVHAQARLREDLDRDDLTRFFDSLLFLPKGPRAGS